MSVFAYFGPSGTFTEIALDKVLAAGVPLPRATGDVQKIAAKSPASTIEMVRGAVADFG
ncbi:prephenate dehydratase, partial [Streptomyces sp. SID10244]|nr:prephenate dehydratase [Streptomyces sp. SID10244]